MREAIQGRRVPVENIDYKAQGQMSNPMRGVVYDMYEDLRSGASFSVDRTAGETIEGRLAEKRREFKIFDPMCAAQVGAR